MLTNAKHTILSTLTRNDIQHPRQTPVDALPYDDRPIHSFWRRMYETMVYRETARAPFLQRRCVSTLRGPLADGDEFLFVGAAAGGAAEAGVEFGGESGERDRDVAVEQFFARE